ncbi:MAG: hypothetical protein AAGD04_09515 [Pseudomonadota bacterium]
MAEKGTIALVLPHSQKCVPKCAAAISLNFAAFLKNRKERGKIRSKTHKVQRAKIREKDAVFPKIRQLIE